MQLNELRAAIAEIPTHCVAGTLVASSGTLMASIPASVGELCTIHKDDDTHLLAEVIGFQDGKAQLLPFSAQARLPKSARVTTLNRPMQIPCGMSLLGRVINGIGSPIDGAGRLNPSRLRNLTYNVPNALTRSRIDQPFCTGQRAIDALLTIGVGQRVGLFAGSGVGKSTLMGEIVTQSNADANVVVLVGERGREVRPFIEDCLGSEGLSKSIVIVATSDEPPLMRVRAMQTAVAIADDLREQGKEVFFFADSLTRLATAQREIGLLLGEPPTSRGYTPSVFQLLASTLEQLGNSDIGSITAILTVLVDGDDLADPIADSVRSIVDGHIVLSRELADIGHFPAIDIGSSISRTFDDVVEPSHQTAAVAVRRAIATFRNNIDLIRAGAYESGTSREIDAAIKLTPAIDRFLQQPRSEFTPMKTTLEQLGQLSQLWKKETSE